MGQLGVGVLINRLSGNDKSVEAFLKGKGKVIQKLWLADEALHFVFADGYKMCLRDDGQSCCEHRFMSTDDNLKDFIGSTLTGAELKNAPDQEDEYGDCHEIQFLEVQTNEGVFTMVNHNKHNGYYGGFSVIAEEE